MKILKFIPALLLFIQFNSYSNTPHFQESVLFIGDSQTEGYLGEMTYDFLMDDKRVGKIALYGVGSSSPRHWADARGSKNSEWLCQRKARYNNQLRVNLTQNLCPPNKEGSIFQHLNEKKPELVVFQFLGNSMGFSESYINDKVQMLFAKMEDHQRCLFITSPPYYKELVEKNKLRLKTQDYIAKAAGSRCKIILGYTNTSYPKFAMERDNYLSDRIHLSKKGALLFFNMFKEYLK